MVAKNGMISGKNRVIGGKKWNYIGKKWDDGWQKWGDGWQKMGWWLAKNGMLGGKPGRRLGGKPTRSGRWQFLLAPGGSKHSDIRSRFDKKWKKFGKRKWGKYSEKGNIWSAKEKKMEKENILRRKIYFVCGGEEEPISLVCCFWIGKFNCASSYRS